MSRTLSVGLAVFVLWVAFAVVGSAQQPSFEVRFHSAEVLLQEKADIVSRWERDAGMTLAFVVALAALGGVTMILQGLRRPWTKTATVVTGALVSTMTVLNTAMFSADYKTLSARAGEGRRLLASGQKLLEDGRRAESNDDRQEFLDQILRRIKSLESLGSQDAAGSIAATLSALEPVAFAAAPAECGCLAARAPDRAFEYVCATATAPSLKEARLLATDQAVASIAQRLRQTQSAQQPGLPSNSLQRYARSSAEQVDSCVTSARGEFAFSVLLRFPYGLSSENALKAFSLLGPPEPTTRMRLRLDRIHVVQDGSLGGSDWAFDILVDGNQVLRLPDREYTDAPNAHNFVPSADDPSATQEIDVPLNREVQIEVRGTRSFGGDQALGARLLNTTAPLAIPVRNTRDDSNGSFVFHFSVRSP